jgi:collagen type III alpha
MKGILVSLVAVLALSALPQWLKADEKQPEAKGPERIFQQLDANKDGEIAPDEIPAKTPERMKELIRKADANGDKTVTLEEFAAAAREHRAQRAEGAGAGHGGHRPPVDLGQGRPSPEELFRQLDKNNDQQLSLEEFKEGLRAFRQITERRGPGGPGGPAPSGDAGPRSRELMEQFKAADADNDGKLSKEEAPERLKQHFDKTDANGDGFVTPDELKTAVQSLRKPRNEKPEGK